MARVTKNYDEEHNENFKRLYYKTDKDKINEILDRLPEKYLTSLLTLWREENQTRCKSKCHSIMVRYDGYEFYASFNNIAKRIPYLKQRCEFYTLYHYQNVPYKKAKKIVYGEENK